MKFNQFTRRHFLQGAGGAFLTLPFLPSLMSPTEAATLPNPRFLVLYWNAHGGVDVQNIYPIVTNPAVAGNLTSQTLYAAQNHAMKYGNLSALKTTRDSNLNYLATNPYSGYSDYQGSKSTADSFGIGSQGNDLDAGAARVTPIMGSFIADSMLSKMNLLCGVSQMFGAGHHMGATGNFCNMSGTAPSDPDRPMEGGGVMNTHWMPTVDSVIASYPGFYENSNPVAGSVVLHQQYASPYISAVNSSNGVVINGARPFTLGQAFQMLFGSLTPPTQTQSATQAKKSFILNSVYQDYTRVAKGAYGPGRRIGRADRNRLEEFMTSLSSVISGFTKPAAACTVPPISPNDARVLESGDFDTAGAIDPNEVITRLGLFNQLITSAFACGATQIFVMPMPGLLPQFIPDGSPGQTFTDGVMGPDPHQAYYHMHPRDNRQRLMVESHRFFFQYAFHDLAQRLDNMTTPSGNTMLDQSLLYWTHESGYITHYSYDLPIMMAGGAGGTIKTGRYVDYRAFNLPMFVPNFFLGYQGMPYNRMLGTILQAMGVPPSAYEVAASNFSTSITGRIPTTARGTVPGYGHPFHQAKSRVNLDPLEYVWDYQLDDMSVLMPGIS